MNWDIVSHIVSAIAVISVGVFAWEYRKKFKEAELALRFDHLETKQRNSDQELQRAIDENTRTMWIHIDKLEETVEKMQESLDGLHVRCVQQQYNCSVNSGSCPRKK